MTSTKRWLIGFGIAAVILVAGGIAAYQMAVRTLKAQIEQVLGPLGEIGSMTVTADGVDIRKLRIRGSQGWPADEQLRASRILVVPDWRGLLSARVRIAEIRVEGGYLSMLRTPDGKLRVLPSLLERAPSADASTTPEITIASVRLVDGSLDFFDATVRKPPLRLHLEKVGADLDEIALPELRTRTKIALDAVLKGTRHDGRIAVRGWAEIASKESDINMKLRGVDLHALQPYLIKAAETGVRKGSLDLDVQSTVSANRLKAPGSLTLTGLELTSGSSFMGMPRAAVVGLMKDRKDQISIRFLLEGNLADPKFSLNESFASRVGSSLAEGLGVSLEGLAKGVGSAGRGIGEAVGKLFGN